MKTHTIKTSKAELLIIETPSNATNIIFYEGNNSLTWETENHIIKGYDLEGYTILGNPYEIREQDAVELVESWESVAKDGTKVFENYKSDIPKKRTAKESLLSLLESEIYWVNPIKKPNGEDYYYEENHGFDGVELLWDGGSYNEDLGQFEEAEQKTFNRNRSIIFKKVTQKI